MLTKNGALAPTILDQFELTPMQHGMLFESVFSDRPSVNIEQIVMHMDEELDSELLRQAWRSVQRRHAALRTCFRWQGLALPHQEVHADAPLNYEVLDWRILSVARQESELEAFLTADREAGVHLDEPAPMRIRLFRLGDSSWTMVWTFHHALLDGRGFTLVLEEVFAAYERTKRGDRFSLFPAPTMRPHMEALRERDLDAAETFFRAHLAGCEATRLPIERTPGEDRLPKQCELGTTLSADIVSGLERLSSETGTTLYTCLQAAWALTLSRYARTNDVVFGSTRSGRHTFPDAKSTVGCFINTLPVHAHLDEDGCVGDLLGELRQCSIDQRPHEHTPLVDVQRWCGKTGEGLLSTNVVFERYFLDTRLRGKGGAWANRHTRLIEEGSIPLTLALYLDEGLKVRFEYESAVYDEASIERLCRHFSTVLKRLSSADSTTALRCIHMLEDAEREQLAAFGRPANAIKRDGTTYLDVFEAQVRANPDGVALRTISTPAECTYAELDRASNRVAHLLRAKGVGRGAHVALCLPRSIELATALLGVLKAGAAYVPLDPDDPSSALRYKLEDSAAQVVLTNRGTVHAPLFAAERMLFVEELASIEAHEEPDQAVPREGLRDSDPAYVIYTSGSTGAPKGVVISHGALVAHNRAVASLFELEPNDRCLQFASFSFDVAVEEMLSTWLAGATLVLRSQGMSESAAEFLQATEQAAISVLNLPTAFWHELVFQMDKRALKLPSCVRLVVVGGERASRKAHARWAELAPGVRWLNGFGPTETTVTCTAFDPKAEPAKGALEQEIPIGRPTRNATAYVLDACHRPVPIGVYGQLFIGGASVANGYWGAPEKTTARFLDDVAFANERVYASGDLCRWLPGGVLEFSGRMDRQIKLRGFRIEPGEIEAALESLDDIDEALVGLFGDSQLVAWVRSSRAQNTVDFDAELRRELRATLPSHMVPSAFVRIEEFPQSVGGKVDRTQLPAPVVQKSQAPQEPRNDGERALCDLFAEVLDLRGVAPGDSFFDLGGHSLIAIRLLDRIEEELGVRPSFAALRTSPSPSELAHRLAEASEEDSEYVYPIQLEGSKPPLFAIHVLGVNGSYFAPLAAHLGPDQPVVGLTVPLRYEDAPSDVVHVASRYVDEIMRYSPTGPVSLASVSLGGFVAFEVALELKARGRDVGVVALFDALAPGALEGVGVWARVQLHGRELLRRGIPYVREKVDARIHRLRERINRARLRAKRALGLEIEEELRILEFIDSNVSAANEYVMGTYPGTLTLFRATEDVFYSKAYQASALGWSSYAERVETVDVPGDHLSMLAEPHVSTLAEHLKSALLEVSG